MMVRYANLHIKKGVISSHAEQLSSHYHEYVWHTWRARANRSTNYRNYIFVFGIPTKSKLGISTRATGFTEKKSAMVGERIRRESWGETGKWKEKEKVWHKLEKGGITRYMEKLDGYHVGVTKVMVDTWSNGKFKIDGVTHQIIEGLIAEVIEIPLVSTNFSKDKKMSANVVSNFVKDEKEMNKIVIVGTYYIMESIKKLWRYVLRIIIEYFTLDPRFDRIRSHHFVMLNHFRHAVKIYFPFFLFTSMSKSIKGFKNKPINNLALHEGLLLLVYEFLKAQTRGKSLGDLGNNSETASSNSDEVQIVKNKDGDYSSKALPSASNPRFPRKSPRGLPPSFPNQSRIRR